MIWITFFLKGLSDKAWGTKTGIDGREFDRESVAKSMKSAKIMTSCSGAVQRLSA